jgi:hypothetical protein
LGKQNRLLVLAPNKYTDLNTSIISIGGLVIKILQKEYMLKYDDLLTRVVQTKGDCAKEMFLPTLNFLFILGKIRYYKELDTIEFTR